MVEKRTKPESPWQMVIVGVVVGVVGALVMGSADDGAAHGVGLAVAWVGGALSIVGAVAAGIGMGLPWAEWKRDQGK